jgi:hypothetical protein
LKKHRHVHQQKTGSRQATSNGEKMIPELLNMLAHMRGAPPRGVNNFQQKAFDAGKL